jgi:putative endonuclease
VKGAWAEDRAAALLEQSGLRIVARNHRVRGGEIDLIAEEPDETPVGTIVFFEVKQRQDTNHGLPAEFITPRKAALVRRAALEYIVKRFGRDDVPVRFDAVLVLGSEQEHALEWIRDAF